MDANQRDQKQGARTATCLFHPNARQRNDGKSIWSEGKGRRTYARAHPRADACTLRSTCFWKSNVAFMLFGFILSLGFYQHPLRHSLCSFLPPNKVGGRLLTRINNSRIFFLLQLVMKGSLRSHSRSSSPPSCSHRESWVCPPCVVCGTCYPSNESRKDSQYSHTAFPSRLLE